MPAWPGTLPAAILVDGTQEQAPKNTIRTEMDAGPPKVRQRFTAGIRPIKGSLKLTKAQVETLDVFYVTTLKSGSLRFDWTHPRTGAATEFRFTAPPSYTSQGQDTWTAQLELEVLP
jgi:hypothetical protein